MTYRFVGLYSRYAAWNEQRRRIGTYDALLDFWRQHGIVDRCIHMENLACELFDVLRDLGYAVEFAMINDGTKSNTSKHKQFEEYFDDRTARLVADQERFIIEQFGYTAPARPAFAPTMQADRPGLSRGSGLKT